MIYFTIALYVLGGVLSVTLTEAFEEVESDKLGFTVKFFAAIAWPLIALLVAFIPAGVAKR